MRSQMNIEGTVRGYEQVIILRQTDLMMTVTPGRRKVIMETGDALTVTHERETLANMKTC